MMFSYYQRILCFILLFPLGIAAQSSEEIESLQAQIRKLQAENSELKSKLAAADVTIEEQGNSLSQQEERIISYLSA